MEKIEIVLFTIIKKNSLIKIVENNKLNIGKKEIKFSVNAIRWLDIILDSGLKFKIYID